MLYGVIISCLKTFRDRKFGTVTKIGLSELLADHFGNVTKKTGGVFFVESTGGLSDTSATGLMEFPNVQLERFVIHWKGKK